MSQPAIRTPDRDQSPEWLEAWNHVDEIERLLKRLPHTRAQGIALRSTLILRDALSDLRDEGD